MACSRSLNWVADARFLIKSRTASNSWTEPASKPQESWKIKPGLEANTSWSSTSWSPRWRNKVSDLAGYGNATTYPWCWFKDRFSPLFHKPLVKVAGISYRLTKCWARSDLGSPYLQGVISTESVPHQAKSSDSPYLVLSWFVYNRVVVWSTNGLQYSCFSRVRPSNNEDTEMTGLVRIRHVRDQWSGCRD